VRALWPRFSDRHTDAGKGTDNAPHLSGTVNLTPVEIKSRPPTSMMHCLSLAARGYHAVIPDFSNGSPVGVRITLSANRVYRRRGTKQIGFYWTNTGVSPNANGGDNNK